MRNVLALLAILLLTFAASAARPDARPIVFVPGIIGSTLVEKDNPDSVIWGTLLSLRKAQTAKMNLLPGTGTPVALVPADVLRDFNLAFGTFEVGIYSHLIDFLTGQRQSAADRQFAPDLKEGESFFVFSYDWRRSVFANGVRLAEFIETNIPSGDFDVVAHSMGGLVTRAMLSDRRPADRCLDSNATYPQGLRDEDLAAVCNAAYFGYGVEAWAGKPDLSGRLHSFVEVGVPHFGSVATVSTFRNGAGGRLANRLLGGLEHLQDVSSSMVSVFELTPTYPNCCWIKNTDQDSYQELHLFRDSFIQDHWAANILPLNASPCPFSNCAQRRAIVEIGLANRALLDQIMADTLPDGIRANHILRGTKTSKTPSRYYVERPFRNAEDSIFVDTSLNGDGTVHEFSAKAPGDERIAGVNEGLIAFTKHQALFSDSATKRYLGRFVIDEVAPPPSWSSVDLDDLVIAGARIDAMRFEANPAFVEPGQQVTLEFILERVNTTDNAFNGGALQGLNYTLQRKRLDVDETQPEVQPVPETLSLAEEIDLRAHFRGIASGPEDEGIYLYEVLKDGEVYGETTVYVLRAEG